MFVTKVYLACKRIEKFPDHLGRILRFYTGVSHTHSRLSRTVVLWTLVGNCRRMIQECWRKLRHVHMVILLREKNRNNLYFINDPVRCKIHNSDVWKRSVAITTVVEERSYITRQWWKIARQLTGGGRKSITIFNWLVNRGVCAAVCSLDNLKRWLRLNYNVSRSVIHPPSVYYIRTTLFLSLSFFLFLGYRWARPLTVRSIQYSPPPSSRPITGAHTLNLPVSGRWNGPETSRKTRIVYTSKCGL